MISTVFEVLSGTLMIMEDFVLPILEYLSCSLVLLATTLMQPVFYLYRSSATIFWIIESVEKVLSYIFSLLFMMYSALEFILHGIFVVVTKLSIGTWYALNYTVEVIAVSIVGINNTVAQITRMLFIPFITSRSNLPSRNELSTSLDVDTIKEVFTVLLGTFVCVLVVYYTTTLIWKTVMRMNEQNWERRRREEETRQPQHRQRVNGDRQQTEEQEAYRRVFSTDNQGGCLLTRTEINRIPEGRRRGIKGPQSVPFTSQNSSPSTQRSVPGSPEEIGMESEVKRLEEELAKEVESKQCVVCLDNPRRLMVKPCNHYCLCEECRRHLTNCPICTGRIVQVEVVFNV